MNRTHLIRTPNALQQKHGDGATEVIDTSSCSEVHLVYMIHDRSFGLVGKILPDTNPSRWLSLAVGV
jgi:hypothetical protein